MQGAISRDDKPRSLWDHMQEAVKGSSGVNLDDAFEGESPFLANTADQVCCAGLTECPSNIPPAQHFCHFLSHLLFYNEELC